MVPKKQLKQPGVGAFQTPNSKGSPKSFAFHLLNNRPYDFYAYTLCDLGFILFVWTFLYTPSLIFALLGHLTVGNQDFLYVVAAVVHMLALFLLFHLVPISCASVFLMHIAVWVVWLCHSYDQWYLGILSLALFGSWALLATPCLIGFI